KMPIRWTPLPHNIYKLNIDGAYQENSNTGGAGRIIRDSHGNSIDGFSSNIVATLPLQAELIGLLKGLELSFTKNRIPLIVETNCPV
ncbi:hypothetical protein A4A49_55711, partial [Nicotiana attenuata]